MKKFLIVSLALTLALVCIVACSCSLLSKQYAVSFYDEEGQLLESKKWTEGKVPSFNYQKENTEEYTYVFEGWATAPDGEVLSELPAVTKEAKYYAIVTVTTVEIKISFSSAATDVASVKVEALSALNSVFDKESANMGENDKDSARFLLELYSDGLQSLTGSVDEIKESANKMYSQLSIAMKAMSNANASLKQLKDQAQKQLDAIVLGAKSAFGELTSELSSAYNAAKSAIEQCEDSSSAKETINEIVKGFQDKVAQTITTKINEFKTEAKTELDSAVQSVLEKIEDQDLKTELQAFYTQESEKINAIDSLNVAKTTLAEIKTDAVTFANKIAKDQIGKYAKSVKTEIDAAVTSALEKIDDEDLRKELQDLCDDEPTKIEAVDSLDSAKTTLAEIKADVLEELKKLSKKQIEKWQSHLKTELDSMVNDTLEKVEDRDLKESLQDFYSEEIKKIEAIDSLDNAKTTLDEIKSDVLSKCSEILAKQLKKTKDNAKAKLDEIVTEALTKIDDAELKTQLQTYYTTEISKIDAIDSIDGAKETANEVVEDTKLFVKELAAKKIAALRDQVKTLLATLSTAINSSAYDYLPEAMRPGYSANLVTRENVDLDYATDFVSISDINYGGFGSQWNMILENINHVETIYKFLSTGESILNTSFVAVNEYLSSKYADTIDVSIEKENYSVTLAYTEEYVLISTQYKTSVSNAAFGSVTPTIEMKLDLSTKEKTVFVKLTDTVGCRYVVSDTQFLFTLTGGFGSGNVTTYCEIIKNADGTGEGTIYEFVDALGKSTKSAAKFEIGKTYVTAVGNKADSIMGFKGTVCELYDKTQGELLGFEVKETSSGKTYNTLWFNLDDIDNLSSIKITEKDKNGNKFSENDTYINGGENTFYVEIKSLLDLSRKYDVEMKLRYFYGMDGQGKVEKYEVQVPMMFIQEECLSSFVSDMANGKHNNWQTEILTPTIILDTIMDEYNTQLPAFETLKESKTSQDVKNFIFAIE